MGTKTCIRIRTHINRPGGYRETRVERTLSGSGSKLKLAFDRDRIPSALMYAFSTCDEKTAIPSRFSLLSLPVYYPIT